MVELAAVVVVEGESSVGGRLEVVAADAIAGVSLAVYWGEDAVDVLKDPKRPGAGSVESDVVEFTTMVVVESEGDVVGGAEIVTSYSRARIALAVDGREDPVVVLEDPDGACASAVEDEMIKFPTVVVVESEGGVVRGAEIVTSYPTTRIPFVVD